MKRFCLFMALAVMLASVFAGCGGGEKKASPTAEKIEFKLGHVQAESDFWHKGALKFKEEVEKNSQGNMSVKIYPNATLGGDRDMAEGMQMGTMDFAFIAGVLGNFDKSISLLELPYLFDNQEQFNAVIHGPIGQEIADRLVKNANIRILSWWDRGPREVTSNVPINSLADIQGLKIRLPEIQAMVDTWKHMGATPTPMAMNEVYTGLSQHVIDAQENPISIIYSAKLYEVQKYLALTDHKYEYVTMSMSEKRWKSLNDEQKKIITDAAKVATEYQNKLVKDETDKLLEDIKKAGVQVSTPDKAAFSAKAREAHETYAKTVDAELYKKILTQIGR